MEAWQNIADVKLRNAHLAVVERQKLVDYLLNASHPDNGGKAKLRNGGFSPFRARREHIIEGWLVAHTGTGRRAVRTVWIVDAGSEAPRLVTAYPGKE